MSEPHDNGAHAAEEKKGSRWWLWLLLALIALALIVWAVLAFTGDDEDDVDAVDPQTTASAPVTPTDDGTTPSATPSTSTTASGDPTATATATSDPTATAVAGAVLVGGVDVLTDGTDLTTLVGQQVQATEVEVTEVVADEAFYVGPQAGQTVLVRLPEFAGADAAESPFTVEQGDVVSFTGSLAEVDDALLSELRNYDPAPDLQVGSVYVQAEQISGVS
ncbi:hypothetical protein MO973_00975 [Paenibacillus sp. TRM 82003]|uniref:hypothetical protein n=1 Tax=Kineococcus sp. TRM81007 TaxID=2925831 RepID=UPI001F58ACF8|nr:hypothetical protein [Kineococcus sp. TRM81007]MCI2239435.1 hypothetical protein [Kineococcus sp. TRM81007]MCI3918805.1 hypothetical protein [Paenibacillus sp. TRM 82003]